MASTTSTTLGDSDDVETKSIAWCLTLAPIMDRCMSWGNRTRTLYRIVAIFHSGFPIPFLTPGSEPRVSLLVSVRGCAACRRRRQERSGKACESSQRGELQTREPPLTIGEKSRVVFKRAFFGVFYLHKNRFLPYSCFCSRDSLADPAGTVNSSSQ